MAFAPTDLLVLALAAIFTGLGVWLVRRGIKRVVAGEGVPPAGEQVIYERKVALHSWTLGSWGPGTRWIRQTPQSIFIEEEPEIPLASIKSCEIKTWGGDVPHVNLQFADSLGKTKRVKLFIPALFGKATGPQVGEVYDAIMRARGVKVKTRDELPGKTSALKNSKGELASTKDGRLSLYRSALTALIEAGGHSYIIFECKERPECYVQFLVMPDTSELCCEVSSGPVSERKHGILFSRGFKAPDNSTPNYSQNYGKPQAHKLAEIVEIAFRDVLDCPDSYTARVVEALYQ
jgi:hypothetical protein